MEDLPNKGRSSSFDSSRILIERHLVLELAVDDEDFLEDRRFSAKGIDVRYKEKLNLKA